MTAAVDSVAAAQARLLADHSFQFSFTAPRKAEPPPSWLVAFFDWLGRVLHAIGPALSYIVWGVLILGVILVVAFLVWELVFAPGVARRRATPHDFKGGEPAVPSRAKLLALLADADALAGEGRFAEAAHVLLHRSIVEVEGRRPDLLRPALTSREIGALPELPEGPRAGFVIIARIVERAFFGGREVAPADWRQCRDAYERFALAEGWSAG